jgi:hypothetical protein
MEEDCNGIQGPQQTSVLDEQEDHQMNQATISKHELILKMLQICNSFVSWDHEER